MYHSSTSPYIHLFICWTIKPLIQTPIISFTEPFMKMGWHLLTPTEILPLKRTSQNLQFTHSSNDLSHLPRNISTHQLPISTFIHWFSYTSVSPSIQSNCSAIQQSSSGIVHTVIHGGVRASPLLLLLSTSKLRAGASSTGRHWLKQHHCRVPQLEWSINLRRSKMKIHSFDSTIHPQNKTSITHLSDYLFNNKSFH